MKRIFRSILAPVAVPVLFFLVAAVPVEVIGCRQRGLAAAAIAITGALWALTIVVKALVFRIRGDDRTADWAARALILSLPAVFIVLTEG